MNKPDDLPLESVELHPAFMWDCPHCGRENFTRSVSLRLDEMSPEDRAEIEQSLDLFEDPGEVVFQASPTTVKCKFCSFKYQAVPAMPEEE